MTQSQFMPPMHPEDDLLFPPTEDHMIAPYGVGALQHHWPVAPEAAYTDWNTADAAELTTFFIDALHY